MLVIVRLRAAPDAVLIDSLPRYAKALNRWFRVPERAILAAFSLLAGAPVSRAAPPSVRRGSPALNLQGMKIVQSIVEGLGPAIESDPWVSVTRPSIGRDPSVASMFRRGPWHEIWPQVLTVALAVDALGGRRPVVAWSPRWPAEWEAVASRELREAFGVDFVGWPRWARAAAGFAANVGGVMAIFGMAFAALVRTGRRRPPVPCRVAIELIEDGRLGGGPQDTNFFEVPERIRRPEFVLYLTPPQASILRRHGRDADAMVARARTAGFVVVDLRRTRLTLRSVGAIWGMALRSLRAIGGAGCLAQPTVHACRDVALALRLFDACAPEAVLHTLNPNGLAGARLGTAAVTGIARARGVRSIGYQNRCTYDTVYEDCYDCYDVYLAWGPGWRRVLGDGNRFLGEIVSVGCLDNGGRAQPSRGSAPASALVAVFTSELEGSLFRREPVLRLLNTCVEIAAARPDCVFEIKMKDPETVESILSDPAFDAKGGDLPPNFRFLHLARHDVADLIARADIVLASAWTSPGADALALGKRVIFYSEFGSGGLPYAGLPGTIAESPEELKELFVRALGDFRTFAQTYESILDSLDPFRDGMSAHRVLDVLLQPAALGEDGAIRRVAG